MKSGFGQICPIAVACEVFAERWTPIILRELFSGSQHFNEIRRGVPLMSSALLAQRLRTLEANGVIVRERVAGGRGHRYCLTGPRELVRAFPSWLMLSHFAKVPRPERKAVTA